MSFQPGEDSDTARLAARHAAEKPALGRAFAIVASRFNDAIVERLVAGARQALLAAGTAADDIALYRCPGALELPGLVRRVVDLGRYKGVVVLGCVIRGDTPHFDYICGAVAHGLTAAAAATGIPMAFGVLTTNSVEEALARAGDGPGNKGREAAAAAMEMAEVVSDLTKRSTPK